MGATILRDMVELDSHLWLIKLAIERDEGKIPNKFIQLSSITNLTHQLAKNFLEGNQDFQPMNFFVPIKSLREALLSCATQHKMFLLKLSELVKDTPLHVSALEEEQKASSISEFTSLIEKFSNQLKIDWFPHCRS